MPETSIAEAKTQLTRLIHQAERGEAVHITRRGKPVDWSKEEVDSWRDHRPVRDFEWPE